MIAIHNMVYRVQNHESVTISSEFLQKWFYFDEMQQWCIYYFISTLIAHKNTSAHISLSYTNWCD